MVRSGIVRKVRVWQSRFVATSLRMVLFGLYWQLWRAVLSRVVFCMRQASKNEGCGIPHPSLLFGGIMTIEDIKKMSKEILTPNDVAPILECDPNVIRYQAAQDIKQLGFPASKIGTRVKIPRQAFIDWFTGKNV